MVHSTRHLEQPFQLAARRCPHPIFLDPSARLSVRVRDTNLTLEAGQRGELSLLGVSEGLAAEGRGRLLKARSCHFCPHTSSLGWNVEGLGFHFVCFGCVYVSVRV